MKMVINTCYGGFGLTDEALAVLGVEDEHDVSRRDPRLVKMVEEDAEAVQGDFAELKVVDIPEEATDWMIQDYDGVEMAIYVVDGKLHYAG